MAPGITTESITEAPGPMTDPGQTTRAVPVSAKRRMPLAGGSVLSLFALAMRTASKNWRRVRSGNAPRPRSGCT